MTKKLHNMTIGKRSLFAATMSFAAMNAVSAQSKKNVLFIAVDDLRGDWISPAKGPGSYPGIITPNIQKLADEGLTFTRAYTAAPWCCPSRTALLTGVPPSQSGVYHHLDDHWRESPELKDAITLPQYFRQNGYWTVGAGKIFHHAPASQDPRSWDQYYPNQRECMNWDKGPQNIPLPACGAEIRPGFDWAPLNRPKQKMEDWKVADNIIEQLQRVGEQDKPFFIACGFFRPHLPWFVPKEYYDLYPLDKIRIPPSIANDLSDVPPIGRRFAHDDNLNAKLVRAGLVKQAIQGYLASVTFADECVGRVLDALDHSPFKDNTVVVLWSDNGWQFGEKEHWEKVALWDPSCRVVLQIRDPQLTLPGSVYSHPVSLMDIYPTLVSLCGLPERPGISGMDLTPILKDPDHQGHPPVLSTLGHGNHVVFGDRWEYIRYRDGTEELYDRQKDPYEWHNLASNPEWADVKKKLGGTMPVQSQEAVPLKITNF